MRDKKNITVGISCGDINGIGLEILVKSFAANKLFDRCIPILYVPVKIMADYMQKIKIADFDLHIIEDSKQALMYKMNIINLSTKDIKLNLGTSTKSAAHIAIDSLNLAINDLKNNCIDILITLPLNKHNISLVKKDFVGHTEHLSEKFNNKENLMLLCSNELKIATVTNHIAVSNISRSITKSIIDKKINILYQALIVDFLIPKPKIAILSLNPHSGDNGLIGYEDSQIINPVIRNWIEGGYAVFGPYAADAFFGSKNYKNFDAILAMYHDQALIPFKTISFGAGVNYTAGLPVVRVSPDHGVAYDIAGKGLASNNSFVYALLQGLGLYSNRKVYSDSLAKTKTKQ